MGTLPSMTPAERSARAAEKRQRVLSFLASEGWSDISTIALLLKLHANSTARLLRSMHTEHLVAREEIETGLRTKAVVWGITPTGIVACDDAPITTQEYHFGRIKALNLPHQTGVQQLRIRAERAGWTNWQPGRAFYKSGLPVVPDAVATDPAGIVTAIELERNVKSPRRRAEVLSGHVMCIVQKHWQRVVYVTDYRCSQDRLKELYMSLDKIKTLAGETAFTDSHKKRFRFCSFNDFAKRS